MTHEAYAAALLEVGRDDEAMTEFRSALILLPKQPRFRALILYQLADLEVKNGNYAQAIERLCEAVNLDSQAMNYHLLLARALAHEGHAQEAEERYAKRLPFGNERFINPPNHCLSCSTVSNTVPFQSCSTPTSVSVSGSPS